MKQLFLIACLIPVLSWADTQCIAVKISDGDTFTCAKGYGNNIQVRLADIDAPESGQAYGNQARKALNKLIYKQMVTLKKTDNRQQVNGERCDIHKHTHKPEY